MNITKESVKMAMPEFEVMLRKAMIDARNSTLDQAIERMREEFSGFGVRDLRRQIVGILEEMRVC
jgi:hypothetical protein